jgi:TonB family protein
MPTVTVEYRVPEHPIKRGLGKIPGIGLLHHLHRGNDEEFIPARPLQDVRPYEGADLARELPGERRVELEITVDKRGRVVDVDSLSASADDRLVHAAAGALYPASFRPAQSNGKNVTSRLRVMVLFRNPPG